MALDPQLLDILACPDTHHAPLDYDAAAQTLTCTQCRRIFEVRDDIPVLLLDEARLPEPGSDGARSDGARSDGARSDGARSDGARSDGARSDEGEAG